MRTVQDTSACAANTGTTIHTQTFTYDPHGWMKTSVQTIQLPGTQPVTRTQSFDPRADGTRQSATHAGNTITYAYDGEESPTDPIPPSGIVDKITDWHGTVTTYEYLPSGAPRTIAHGAVADATFTYRPNGATASVVWEAGSNVVRSHTNLTYDLGGYMTDQTVTAEMSNGSERTGTGTSTFDLAGRLDDWTSPFGEHPRYDYTLDDAGNITKELITANGTTTQTITSDYADSRLQTRTDDTPATATTLQTTAETDFGYTMIGEEKLRETTVTVAGLPIPGKPRTTTTYDPAGYVDKITDQSAGAADVDHVYDANDRVIARTRTGGTTNNSITLYFYWGGSTSLAEETNDAGVTRTRYLITADEQAIAQQTYPNAATGQPNPSATPQWSWLLRDEHGNVATHLLESGTTSMIDEVKAYLPYGKPDVDGSDGPSASENANAREASELKLGFQSAMSDKTTGNVLLGPRQYDPELARFTSPDTFIGSALGIRVETDPLTGNRYMFAAANPVAYYDDGHWPDDLGWEDLNPVDQAGDLVQGDGAGEALHNRIWHVTRAGINFQSTTIGLVNAGVNRADCELAKGLMIACTGASGGFRNGGTDYGNVYITGDREYTADVLDHETGHADQYALMGGGILFPIAYGVAEVKARGDKRCNWFERNAGLAKGGYNEVIGEGCF